MDDDTVLLSDFGIAIIANTTNYTAESQDKMGSIPYMSPEHIQGKARPASDQYSLGIVTYELLCGRTPFEGMPIQLMYQHMNVLPPPLHDEIAILPAVEKVVMKALKKDPKQRFSSVIEFAQALEEASMFPGDSYYPSNVAQAIRGVYFRSSRIANLLNAPINISEIEAAPIKSHRGTEGYMRPFTKGAIYWCERGGSHPVFLGFAYSHKYYGGVKGLLGFPLSDEEEAAPSRQGSTGTFQRFEGEEDYPEDINVPPIRCGATAYWRRDDEAVYVVKGKIGESYERLHGTCGFLGFPISVEKDIGPFLLGSTGRYQDFEGGSIYWKEGSSMAFSIRKVIGEFYHSDHDARHRLGFPIAKESRTITSLQGTTGKYQRFEGGAHDSDEGDYSKGVALYWSNKYGAYPVFGGIGICYERLGGANSTLGFPISQEMIAAKSPQDTEGWHQQFEGGSIHWCEKYQGVPVMGSIHEAYKAHGGSRGRFGFPIAEQKPAPGQLQGSFIQEFEGGVIGVYAEQSGVARKWDMHDVPGIVDHVYRQVLRRPVEDEGLITYGAKLNRGEKSVRGIVKDIGCSNEFSEKFLDTKPDNEQKVDLCFEHFLGRGADLAARSTYIELAKDKSLAQVIEAIIVSEEYSLAFGDNYAPIITTGLSIVSQTPGKLDCFYRGLNGHLYHRKGMMPSWESTVISSDTQSMQKTLYEGIIVIWEDEVIDEGGYLTSAPASVSWGANHLECFYRGGDNCLWHRWWYGGGAGYEGSLGGHLTSAPTVVSTGENSMDCFYRGANNHLIYRYWNGKFWEQEVDLGGFLTSAPSAVSWGPKHLDCFYRGVDGGLHHRWREGEGWSYEDNIGGYLTSAPIVTSTGENRLDCFYRGLNFHLLHRRWDEERWNDEKDLDGMLASAPAAIALGGDYIDCFYRGQDKCLWHRWRNGKRWNPEENLGGILI